MHSWYKVNQLLFLFIGLISTLTNCSSPETEKKVALYSTHCGSCHLAPDIESLPKDIWENNILPDMAARMGIATEGYNPFEGKSFDEMEATMKTGIYSASKVISKEDWELLRDYILSLAPESLPPTPQFEYSKLSDFEEIPMELDDIPGSKNITFLNYLENENKLIYADLRGEVYEYDWIENENRPLGLFSTPVVSYSSSELGTYVATIGQLSPTQISTGQVFVKQDSLFRPVAGYLHRPVHMLVEDLDKDSNEEIVISEFGDLVGQLSLLLNRGSQGFEKRILLNQPGAIRVIGKDMNGDSQTDLVVLTAQGDEGITIFYQEQPLQFRAERVLRFSPVYGTSWFDLLDYDGDGDLDIITVNGDNADKSYVHKPYHGLRIHLNDGSNNFEEVFFYPLNGATRFIGNDFDNDGDVDFCVLATFPDYDNKPFLPFVYLKNENPDSFEFRSELLNDPTLGRWLLAQAGDIDQDGDEDLILSSFTYVFTPVPDSLNTKWNRRGIDLLILKNKSTNDE